MKWWRLITPNVASRKESANVGKNINVRRWWWHSIIIAASKCTAYQKKNLRAI